jgi:hypothetical protein
MERRATIELRGADGTTQTREVARAAPYSMLGPPGLIAGRRRELLAGVQRFVIRH